MTMPKARAIACGIAACSLFLVSASARAQEYDDYEEHDASERELGYEDEPERSVTSAPPVQEAPPEPAPSPRTAQAPEPEPEREAHERDGGSRRRWFWIEASGGYSWINLLQMRDENFTSEPELLSGSGFFFEGGLGISLLRIFQIGMTASYAMYSNFDVVTAELDLTIVIPIPIIEPFIRAGVGYAHFGEIAVASGGMGGMQEKARVNGIAVDLGAGLDLHLSDAFQLGFAVDASFLNLRRQRVTELGTLPHADFTQTGNALGLQINGSVRLTFQF